MKSLFQKYAETVLKTGVNLQPGQCVVIRGEPVHWELASAIEAEAYRMGAKLVECDLIHAQSAVNRSLYQKESYLDFIPGYQSSKIKEQIDEKWALIRLEGVADPDLAKQIDQKRNALTVKAERTLGRPLMLARLSGVCSWCIMAAATDGWARQVGLRDKDELWEVLVPILKLDQPDPGQAWKRQSDLLAARSRTLNELEIEYLHFAGPDTDLKVYPNPLAVWEGGGFKGENGQTFIPNLPTEEVFTVPEYRRTEGKVRVTRPVNVLGDQVRDAWFEFRKGELVNYGASYGKHLLDEFVKIDPKARFLGEVALVDAHSPIFKSGKVFNSILLDENASCHIALGSGFGSLMKGAGAKSEDELDALGCNKALLHTDFMIGSEKISVTAHTRKGTSVAVIRDGVFVI